MSGVPQGSILGPILFILYLNDLPECAKDSKLLSFADDTKCYRSTSNEADTSSLQADLNRIGSWVETWKLNFNLSKCALVHFHSSRQEIATSHTMGDTEISNPECHNDLGIIFSGNLSWTKHHEYILAKAYGKLSIVRQTFSSYCTVGTRKKLYISLIRSQLVYGSQLWRPMLIKDISSLEQLQRRVMKFILQDYTSDYKPRLLCLNLLPLMMLYELNDIMFFINNIKNRSESFDIPH